MLCCAKNRRKNCPGVFPSAFKKQRAVINGSPENDDFLTQHSARTIFKATICCGSFAKQVAAIIAQCKGLAKLGNIVAETLLRAQMFPS